ncbi:MAG TPA: hypothetical protein VJ735_16305 [Actinomycetes bacterium]|nr:hypothetical protein [Actinomycetes bacterium]
MQLPNAPFYRRWSVLLAGVIGLAAIGALLGWNGLQQVERAAPTSTAPTATVVTSTTTAPTTTSFATTSKPDDVIWEREGSDVVRSPGLEAPGAWRIVWEYDCTGFGHGGNFKITGSGAFARVDIQRTELKANGRNSYARAGFGRLLVESVCDHWKITVLAG